MGCDGGVMRYSRPRVEELHPAANGIDTATGSDRLHEFENDPGNPLGVAGRVGVIDGSLGHPVRLVPVGGTFVELDAEVRIVAPKLGLEMLAQQVVVAIPLAAAIERYD